MTDRCYCVFSSSSLSNCSNALFVCQIRPDQVVKTKLAILKHMPYLIFHWTDSDLEAFVDPFAALNSPTSPALPADKPEESQLVSSIYFDSPSTSYSYGRRILRLEGAELVRFRQVVLLMDSTSGGAYSY